MAEGIVRHLYNDKIEAFSAGAKVTSVHPLAIQVMGEIDIDISSQRSKQVEEFAGEKFDYVITLCGDSAKDVCPVFPGDVRQRLNWSFPDPAKAEGTELEILNDFRKVRDQVRERITEFAKSLTEA